MFLPKKIAWLIFLFLLYFDLGLTWFGAGREGNPLCQLLIEKYGFGLVGLMIIPVVFLALLWG